MTENSSMSLPSESLLLPITGLVLAGGAGRRMGGEDKGWLSFAGRPLVQHALRPLRSHAREILISANRHQERYAALGYPVLADAQEGFPGPLHGLLAGLMVAQEDWIAFVPVDAPHLPRDLPLQLWHQRKGVPLVLARDEHSVIPVIGLMHRRLTGLLRLFLSTGQSRAGDFFAPIPQHHLHLSALAARNCNRPEDLEESFAC